MLYLAFGLFVLLCVLVFRRRARRYTRMLNRRRARDMYYPQRIDSWFV